MKALILVGGFGTRLRPLTFTCPKPLVPFINKPMIMHQIEALAKVGVTEVVLAVGYEPEKMKEELDEAVKQSGLPIKITYSLEEVPMGTAGPIALASDILTENGNDLFFVLNSDVSCMYPLEEFMNFHKKTGAEGSILVTPVKDPSKYGVVKHDDKGKIEAFIEKPKVYVGSNINAGIYIFNTSILKRIPKKPTSIEREIFPKMAAENQLYAMELPGFWMDVGQPHDFLTGMCLYLDNHNVSAPQPRAGVEFVGDVIVPDSAIIGEGCKIGPNVVIGENCVIEPGCRISRATIMRDSTIRRSSYIHSTIVGWSSRVGPWAHLTNETILGEDVSVSEGTFINGGKVCLHKGVKENILEKGTIIL